METQFTILLIISLLLILLLLIRLTKPKNKSRIQIPPPGPWKLPLLGNLHQLIAASMSSSSSPHHILRQLSLKYGTLMHLQVGQLSTVVVSSPDMAKQIMKTHDLAFVQRSHVSSNDIFTYKSTDIACAPYGDYWRQMKKLCTLELLSFKRVQSFSSIRQYEVSKLIDSVGSSLGSVVDMTTKIYSLTSTIVTKVAFGNEQKELLQLFFEAMKEGGFRFVDFFPSLKLVHLVITKMEEKLMKIHKKVDKIFEDIIKENQKKMQIRSGGGCGGGEENLVQVLLRIQQSESLDISITNDNIKAIIWDMFGAGTDTSSSTTEWAMTEMMRNPKIMEKAQAEIREAFKGKKVIEDSDMEQLSYLKLVIKETLRLHPPLPLLLPRECRENCKIVGYNIPIKTQVVVNAWAIGRDPNYWYDSERFTPERFQGNCNVDFRGTNFEFIPFGAGRRMCPGITFGLASIELPLASLLYHFDWELPYGMKPEDLDMTDTMSITARRKEKLCLIAKPYKIDPACGGSR